MLRLALSLPKYWGFRNLGFPVLLPFNYTFSLTYRCNSRCRTCNIWKLQNKIPIGNELKVEEWEKIVHSIGRSPFWITLSGGEPFLRKDLEEIIYFINAYNKPKIINIPTNALIDSSERIKRILDLLHEKTYLIINFSLDGIGKTHDYLRGIPGNWEKFLSLYKKVKKLSKDYENFVVGIHTVVSKWNVKQIPEIYSYVKNKLRPHQYITEIAENRKELNNINEKIAPKPEEYKYVAKYLISQMKEENWQKISKITKLFRIKYYEYTVDVLEKKKFIKSYAGFASTHITPLGEVWDCAAEGNELGRLKDFDYNFKKLWKSKKAREAREKIKAKHKCILANEFYSNILFNFKVLCSLFFNFLRIQI